MAVVMEGCDGVLLVLLIAHTEHLSSIGRVTLPAPAPPLRPPRSAPPRFTRPKNTGYQPLTNQLMCRFARGTSFQFQHSLMVRAELVRLKNGQVVDPATLRRSAQRKLGHTYSVVYMEADSEEVRRRKGREGEISSILDRRAGGGSGGVVSLAL